MISVRCLTLVARVSGVAACAVVGLLTVIGLQPAIAIDVKLSAEEAQKALEACLLYTSPSPRDS